MSERIGFGLYQLCWNRGSVGHVSVFWLLGCGWCRREWPRGWRGLDQGLRGWSGVIYVCCVIICVDGTSRYLYIVLGEYLCILCAPSVQSYRPYRYLLHTVYLSVADIANPDLLGCNCRIWISFDITHFNEEQCQPSSGSSWQAFQKQ